MLQADDIHFMHMALNEATAAGDAGEVPIGAVIVHDGKIIGKGRNTCESLQDSTAHAEMLAITAASDYLGSWRLEECTLYCTIEPCPMCMGACLNSRIKRVVYGAPEPKAGACGSLTNLAALPGYNHTIAITAGVEEDTCAELMRTFFRRLRARKAARKNNPTQDDK